MLRMGWLMELQVITYKLLVEIQLEATLTLKYPHQIKYILILWIME